MKITWRLDHEKRVPKFYRDLIKGFSRNFFLKKKKKLLKKIKAKTNKPLERF